jgi:hypothetical protein
MVPRRMDAVLVGRLELMRAVYLTRPRVWTDRFVTAAAKREAMLMPLGGQPEEGKASVRWGVKRG